MRYWKTALFFAVVLAGCSREKVESKVESKVSVERQIEVDDDYAITTWSMTLRPGYLSFALIRASPGGADSPKMMSFSDPKEATDALAKFVEWDETARQNNVEPFRKSLADKYTFEFSHGTSALEYYSKTPYATFSGEFSRADVDKFNELLKQVPEAKAELEDKIAKAQKEEALFQNAKKQPNGAAPAASLEATREVTNSTPDLDAAAKTLVLGSDLARVVVSDLGTVTGFGMGTNTGSSRIESIYGRVRNDLSRPVGNMQLRALIYNAAGQLVETKAFNPQVPHVSPGGQVDFYVAVPINNLPTGYKCSVQLIEAHYVQ